MVVNKIVQQKRGDCDCAAVAVAGKPATNRHCCTAWSQRTSAFIDHGLRDIFTTSGRRPGDQGYCSSQVAEGTAKRQTGVQQPTQSNKPMAQASHWPAQRQSPLNQTRRLVTNGEDAGDQRSLRLQQLPHLPGPVSPRRWIQGTKEGAVPDDVCLALATGKESVPLRQPSPLSPEITSSHKYQIAWSDL